MIDFSVPEIPAPAWKGSGWISVHDALPEVLGVGSGGWSPLCWVLRGIRTGYPHVESACLKNADRQIGGRHAHSHPDGWYRQSYTPEEHMADVTHWMYANKPPVLDTPAYYEGLCSNEPRCPVCDALEMIP